MIDTLGVIRELEKLRKSSGLSQRGLAKAMGSVSYGTIQAIESGKVDIWLNDVFKWISACGADPLLWFVQQLSIDQQEGRTEDEKLLKDLRRALRVKNRRQLLTALCDDWQRTDEQRRKLRES